MRLFLRLKLAVDLNNKMRHQKNIIAFNGKARGPSEEKARVAFINKASGLLFIAAKEAAKRALRASGTLGEQNEAMTAVVLCGVVAEASINEISAWYESHHLHPQFSVSHNLPYGFDRLELRVKWSLFPMIVRQRSFNTGAELWQSFNALVELRNFIVHLRDRPLSKSVNGLLRSKKLIEEHHSFLGFPVAQWACETVASMFEELTKLVAPPQEWIPIVWHWTPTHSFPYGLSTPGDSFVETESKKLPTRRSRGRITRSGFATRE